MTRTDTAIAPVRFLDQQIGSPPRFVTEAAFNAIDQALDETMAERAINLQAIEAFMEEREDLKADIEEMAQSAIDACDVAMAATSAAHAAAVEVSRLRIETRALDAACLKAANFVQSLRDQLGRIGIAFHIDPQGGAAISIDLPVLSNSVEAIVESYAG